MSLLKALWEGRWQLFLRIVIPMVGTQLGIAMWKTGDHFMSITTGIATIVAFVHYTELVRLW